MIGLSNNYVENLSKLCIKNFKSVLPCDLFSKTALNIGEKFIVNLSPSQEKNGHFVAICVTENSFTYFDPYGIPCYNPYILSAFHQRPNFKIDCSKKAIQASFSYFCGFFCICFLICDDMKLTQDQFNSLFYEASCKNENICIDIIKSHLSKQI